MNKPPRLAFSRTNASVLLDLMRAVAALLVCMEHWRNLLFVDFRQVHDHKALFAVFYALTTAGHQAVVIFFVLSGYLISGSIFRMVENGKWSWKLYLTHRLVRLWIVLLPALVLGAILDNTGLTLHLAPALYAGQTGTHMLGNVAKFISPSIFAGNVFFLQTILVPTFGSNAPLWNLANEFWYYILFPCAFFAIRPGSSWLARLLNGAILIACALLVGKAILLLFPLWLLGTLLARVKPIRVDVRVLVAVAVLYIPLFFYVAKSPLPPLLADYTLGIATFLFLWLLLGLQTPAPEVPWVHVTRKAAQFSYTLYLVHVPFLVLVVALVAGESKWYPNASHLLIASAILLLAIGYAYAVAWLCEFRTNGVRDWVETKVPGLPRKNTSAAVRQ